MIGRARQLLLATMVSWALGLGCAGEPAPPDEARLASTVQALHRQVAAQHGRVLVGYRSEAKVPGHGQLQALGLEQARRFHLIPAVAARLPEPAAAHILDRLLRDPDVLYVEPDHEIELDATPNDNLFDDQWGMHNVGQEGGLADVDLDAPEAWDTFVGGEVLVGILDTGLDYRHDDLAGNVWSNPGEPLPFNGLDDDGNGYVDDVHGFNFYDDDGFVFYDESEDYHGTHVAGIVGAVGNNAKGVIGVNRFATLVSLKFIGPTGYVSDEIAALEYATLIGIELINGSFSSATYSQAEYDAIQAWGGLFVAAAGNQAQDIDVVPRYPAAYDLPNLITVANVIRYGLIAASSNTGKVSVDLYAPGEDIVSTYPSNTLPSNTYAWLTGTSMSAPHVTGVASLLLAFDPTLDPLTIKQVILSTVKPLPLVGDHTVTNGIVDAQAALLAVKPCVVDADCDDGDLCNGLETCDPVGLRCRQGLSVVCPHTPCHTESCDPGTGQCASESYCGFEEDPCTAVSCDEYEHCVYTDLCCNDDGVCGGGAETCWTCGADCPSGTTPGAVCGNGVCEAGGGEDCVACPADCLGVQGGKPNGRYCCGDGDGVAPVPCTDPRCVAGGAACTTAPVPPVSYCCGDGVCEGAETCGTCATDCATGAEVCSGGGDEDCDGLADCADPDCAADPGCQQPAAFCGDGTCDPGEDCRTCLGDCPGKLEVKVNQLYCCGDGVVQKPEGDGSICDGNY